MEKIQKIMSINFIFQFRAFITPVCIPLELLLIVE